MGGSAPKRKAKAKKNAKAGSAPAAGLVATEAEPVAATGPAPPTLTAGERPRPLKAKPAKKTKATETKPAKRRPEAARPPPAMPAAAAMDLEATAPAPAAGSPVPGHGVPAAAEEADAAATTRAGAARKPGREKASKAAKPRKIGTAGAKKAAAAAPLSAAPTAKRNPARPTEPRTQYGALLHRRTGDAVEIMLVSSRETRRWIIPKGWPIKGLKAHEAAAREAFEEAGVEGRIAKKALGDYPYGKRLTNGAVVPCRVQVFAMAVERERLRWPEMDERTTRWLGVEEAASAVAEPELADLIRRFGTAAAPAGGDPPDDAADASPGGADAEPPPSGAAE